MAAATARKHPPPTSPLLANRESPQGLPQAYFSPLLPPASKSLLRIVSRDDPPADPVPGKVGFLRTIAKYPDLPKPCPDVRFVAEPQLPVRAPTQSANRDG